MSKDHFLSRFPLFLVPEDHLLPRLPVFFIPRIIFPHRLPIFLGHFPLGYHYFIARGALLTPIVVIFVTVDIFLSQFLQFLSPKDHLLHFFTPICVIFAFESHFLLQFALFSCFSRLFSHSEVHSLVHFYSQC